MEKDSQEEGPAAHKGNNCANASCISLKQHRNHRICRRTSCLAIESKQPQLPSLLCSCSLVQLKPAHHEIQLHHPSSWVFLQQYHTRARELKIMSVHIPHHAFKPTYRCVPGTATFAASTTSISLTRIFNGFSPTSNPRSTNNHGDLRACKAPLSLCATSTPARVTWSPCHWENLSSLVAAPTQGDADFL